MNKVGSGGNHLWMMLEEFQLRPTGGFPVMLAFSSEHLCSVVHPVTAVVLFQIMQHLLFLLNKKGISKKNYCARKQIIGLWLTWL